jgi:two-component system OmpR family response regulator
MDSNTMQQQQQQMIHQYRSYTDAATKRILIINYDDDVNFALKIVLEEERGGDKRNYFKVDSFNNPISALKNVKNGSYDLLIIGVVMPQMNGFELAREIRKIDDKVKICFLIAGVVPSKVRFDTVSGQVEGYQDKFIRLPIENKVLIEQIDNLLSFL